MITPRPILLVRAAALIALLGVGAVAVPAAATDRVVVVRAGDTLSEIALRHGLTVAQLMAINAISDPSRIYPGQRLHLAAPAPAATPASPAPVPQPIMHVVRSGEHLTGIARRYGTTIAAIVLANAISDPSYLRVGQQLLIPSSAGPAGPADASSAAPAAAARIHVVGSGENLSAIADRYGTTIAAIVVANAIANPSYLRVGQHLTIPGGGGPPAAVSAAAPSGMAASVAGRGEIRAIIDAEARAQGVPVAFALAVAWQESGWQASVVSRLGAVGVMQITPETATWIARSILHGSVKLQDPRSNVRAGIGLLKHYLVRYHNDKRLVLAAYYQGQTAADRHGVYPMTRSYISSILALEATFAR